MNRGSIYSEVIGATESVGMLQKIEEMVRSHRFGFDYRRLIFDGLREKGTLHTVAQFPWIMVEM